jgi:RNA polymerase sigma factor (sigma-70 family)
VTFVPEELGPVLNDRETEEFFKRHYNGVVRYLASRKSDLGLAEEIANDAFLVVHSKWSTLREPEERKAYLFGVATKMWLKRRARHDRQMHELTQDPPENASPVDAVEQIIAEEYLLSLLDRLPTRQRQVLFLEYVHCFKIEEIARILGISAGTVKRYGHDGRIALRKLIQGEDEGRQS